MAVNKPFETLSTDFSTIEKNSSRGIVNSYGIGSSFIHLAATGTMATGMCESLNLMADKDTVAHIRQPRFKVPNQSFAASGEEITSSKPINQKLFLSQPAKTALGPVPSLQESQFGILKIKTTSPQDWRSIVDLLLANYKTVK